MLEDQVRRIREALGASTDSELAEKLGIGRSAVSRWKERGVIPAKFRFLADGNGYNVQFAAQFIEHDRIFAHADHHFWLRAALHFLPSDYGATLPESERALLIEFVLTRLMSAAADTTARELGKRRCEGESDFQALVSAMRSGYADRIARVLAEGRPTEGPK